MHRLCWVLLLATLAAPCMARDAAPATADPALERRVTAIADELRCLVCQNQTITDSHAPLAIDLKNQIREKLGAGMSEAAIMEYMVARYGDFVLYRPPLKTTTSLLWFGPFVLLAAAFAFLFFYLKRRSRSQQGDAPLDDAEREQVRQILDSEANTK